MIEQLRRAFHLGPDLEERQRTNDIIARVNRAVEEKAQADQDFLQEVVRHHPHTDLAAAMLRARDREAAPS